MGIAIIQRVNPKPQRWSVWNALTIVSVVGVSMTMGVSIGWHIKPSFTTYATSSPTATPSPSAARPSFLLLGDSLTFYGGNAGGWAQRLHQHFGASVDILNQGNCGYNSSKTRREVVPKVLQRLNSTTRPVLITLWLGANDAMLENGPYRDRHLDVPLVQYKANLGAIIHDLREFAPLAKILLITPPVVDEVARRNILVRDGLQTDPPDRTNNRTGIYAAACLDVAAAVENTPDRVAVLDMYTYLMQTYPVASERAKLLRDGVHFNEMGNEVVFEQVKQQILALLPASFLA